MTSNGQVTEEPNNDLSHIKSHHHHPSSNLKPSSGALCSRTHPSSKVDFDTGD